MTIEELKQNFIDKTAEMLNDVEDTENLYKLAEVYSELTKEDWQQKAFEALIKNSSSSFGAFPTDNIVLTGFASGEIENETELSND